MAADAAEVLVGVLHRRDVAHDRHAGRVGGDEQHRRALVLVRVGVGDRHHDQEVRHRGVRGEPLVAVDDPLVALEHRGGLQQRRVRAGVLRLGHRERRAQVAVEQRIQVLVLLVLGARHGEDLGVARVGRGVAEHGRREHRAAEDLVHEAELDLAEALAAEVGRQVGGPQAALLDLLLERRDGALEAVLAELLEDGLDRPDLLAHELAHPVELLLELGLRREVPCHVGTASFGSLPPRVAGDKTRGRGGRPRDRGRRRSARRRCAAVGHRLRFRAGQRAAAVRRHHAGARGRAADPARAGGEPDDARHRGPAPAAAGARVAGDAGLGRPRRVRGRAAAERAGHDRAADRRHARRVRDAGGARARAPPRRRPWRAAARGRRRPRASRPARSRRRPIPPGRRSCCTRSRAARRRCRRATR